MLDRKAALTKRSQVRFLGSIIDVRTRDLTLHVKVRDLNVVVLGILYSSFSMCESHCANCDRGRISRIV